MTDAFLVGAGLSISAAPLPMPSTDELGQAVLDLLKAIHANAHSSHADRCDGLSCDHPVLRPDGRWPASNFEAWLSSLVDDQPYRHQPEQLRAQALYLEIASLVGMEITSRTIQACEQIIPSPSWFATLVETWHERRCEVISLNYDTLVEAAFESLEIHPNPIRPATLGYRDLQPVSIPLWNQAPSPSLSGATFQLTKLHGSIHWYWDPNTRSAESMVDVGLPARWGAQTPGAIWDPHRWVPGREPMIVPPTTSKTSFFTNPIVRKLWRHAFEAIRSSDRLVLIGYSLPHHDTLVGAMLIEAITQRGGLRVTIVNPDPNAAEHASRLGLNPDESFTTIDDFVTTYTA